MPATVSPPSQTTSVTLSLEAARKLQRQLAAAVSAAGEGVRIRLASCGAAGEEGVEVFAEPLSEDVALAIVAEQEMAKILGFEDFSHWK